MEQLMKFFENKVVGAELELKKYMLHILLACFLLALLISIFIIKENLASNALVFEAKISLMTPCLTLASIFSLPFIFSRCTKYHVRKYGKKYDLIIKVISTTLFLIFCSVIVAIFSFLMLGYHLIVNNLNAKDIIIYLSFLIVSVVYLNLMVYGCIFTVSALKTLKEYKTNFYGKLEFLQFVKMRMNTIIIKFVLSINNSLVLLNRVFKLTLSINDFIKFGLAPSVGFGFFLIFTGFFNDIRHVMDNSIGWFILSYGVIEILFVVGLKFLENKFGIKVRKFCRKLICINYYFIRIVNGFILSVSTIYSLAILCYWIMQYDSNILKLIIQQTAALFLLALGYCGLSHQFNKLMIKMHTDNGRL